MSVFLHKYFYLKGGLSLEKRKSFLEEIGKKILESGVKVSYWDEKKDENIKSSFNNILDDYMDKKTKIINFVSKKIEFTISINTKEKYIFFSMNSFFLNDEDYKENAQEIIKKIKEIVLNNFDVESVKESLD